MLRSERGSAESSLLGGAALLSMAAVLVKVLGLLYKVPLSHILGDEGMGYFNAAYTVYGCFYLLCTAGVPKAVSIMTAAGAAEGQQGRTRRIFHICLVTFALLGLVLTASLVVLAGPLSALIGSSPAAAAMIAIAPSLAFVATGGVIRGYLNGHARMWPIAISQLIEGVSKLTLGLLFANIGVQIGLPLPLTAACTILGITAGSLCSFLYLWASLGRTDRTRDQAAEGKRVRIREVLSTTARVAAPVTLSAALMSLTNMLDLSLIITRLTERGLSSAEATALYGNYTTLCVPMFNLAAAAASGMAISVLPHLTREYARGSHEGFRVLFRRTLGHVSFVLLPFTVGLMCFAEPVLCLLFDDTSAALAAPSLIVLGPSMLFMALLTVVNTALEAADRPGAPLVAMGIGCAVKLTVSNALIGDGALGLLGAPIGTVASYATALLIALLMLHRTKDIRIHVFVSIIRPLILSTASVCIAYLAYNGLAERIPDAARLFFVMLLGGGIYLLLSLCTLPNGIKTAKNYVKLHKKSGIFLEN